jgi:hypothetical protein
MKNWLHLSEDSVRTELEREELRVLAEIGYREALAYARLHPTLGWRTADQRPPRIIRGRWRDSRDSRLRIPR